MTPEGKVKKKVVEILQKYGAYYFSPVTGGFGRSGVPDIVACFGGTFIGIECKAGNNLPTALQKQNLVQIQKNGGIAVVVNENDVNNIEQMLKQLKEKTSELDQ